MIVGIDAGGYKTKVMGPQGVISFYSHLGEARELKLKSTFGPDDMIVEYAGRKLFAGSLALHESEFGGSILGTTKAHDDAMLRVLIALFRYGPENNYTIVVGQPIDQHTTSEKTKIQSMLKGTHNITINNMERKIAVHRVEVAAEGAAAIWAATPPGGLIRVVDVGSGTVNCGTVRDKRYVDKDSFTIPYGMNSTKSRDLEAMTDGIARNTLQKWESRDPVYLVGGGAESIFQHMRKYFPLSQVLYPIIRVRSGVKTLHPAYANCVAYYNLAVGAGL